MLLQSVIPSGRRTRHRDFSVTRRFRLRLSSYGNGAQNVGPSLTCNEASRVENGRGTQNKQTAKSRTPKYQNAALNGCHQPAVYGYAMQCETTAENAEKKRLEYFSCSVTVFVGL